jgi:hypothetical protein
MDDDDEQFDFIEAEPPVPPARRFAKLDLAVIGLRLVSDVADVFATSLAMLHDVVALHANFNIQQSRFHEEAAREMETLTAPPEED